MPLMNSETGKTRHVVSLEQPALVEVADFEAEGAHFLEGFEEVSQGQRVEVLAQVLYLGGV